MKKYMGLFCVLITFSCQPGTREKKYVAGYYEARDMLIDGRIIEELWTNVKADTGFTFPWEKGLVPATEFRIFYDSGNLYYAFIVQDDEIVCRQHVEEEEDIIGEDRVEMYFTPDDKLEKYYCFEVDPMGRILDYSSSFPRRFDFEWDWRGLVAAAVMTEKGYSVEGKIPLASFRALGFQAGARQNLRMAVFRAQASRNPDSTIAEHWISWIDPGVSEPDFHVPSAFGFLELK